MECFILNCRKEASIGQKSMNKGGIFGVQLHLPSWSQPWVWPGKCPSLVDSHFDSGDFSPPLPFHRYMAKSFTSGDCNVHVLVQGINAKLQAFKVKTLV